MFKTIVALLCIVGVVNCQIEIFGNTGFEVCPSAKLGEVKRFYVTDCPDGSKSCEFKVGKTYSFEVEVAVGPNHPTVSKLPFKVVASVIGLPITIAEGDACDTVACPIQPNTTVVFKLDKEIPKSLPPLRNVSVFARVWGDRTGTNGNASACATIKISILP